MSFTSFRLGEVITNPPPHLMHLQATTNMYAEPQQNQQPSQFTAIDNTNSFPNNTTKISPASSTKQPYGSGDTDDGYTLVFPNLTAFHQWRQREEEAQVVEFVKGDTHGSKAIPPRFKDHTKLVCARHSRSGRKKYVKKHPERVRKVPSRKLEGQGCPASISFKTYFDSEEVRACYNSQHSHETGPANLPYTRRGRKAVAEAEKKKAGKNIRFADDHHLVNDPTASTPTAETSSVTQAESSSPSNYNSAVSMIAPLPSASQSPYQSSPQQQSYNYQPQYQYASPSAPPPATVPVPSTLAQHAADGFHHDRWQNMETLFTSIREHARTFTYPTASVAALETVLIRLFLESPSQPVISQQPPLAMSTRMEDEGSSDET